MSGHLPARRTPRIPRRKPHALTGISGWLALLLLVLPAAPLTAFDLISPELDIRCDQSEAVMLGCQYRLLHSEAMPDLRALYAGQEIPVTAHSGYPTPDATTLILFLVDTSDPGRQTIISHNASQITRLMATGTDRHRFGLASFDKELRMDVAPGGDHDAISRAAMALTAAGMTTELYRNTIKAIELLGQYSADRKAILLFSDGQAEDQAYYHQDVILAARRHGVIINGLGFARSTPLSVALQTLRRLSEESGGIYVEADANGDLPDAFMNTPWTSIDRGGQFVLDLSGLTSVADRPAEVAIRLETPEVVTGVRVPVSLPRAVTTPVVAPTPVPTPVVPVVVTEPAPLALPDRLLWYGVPFALVLLIILTIISLVLLARRSAAGDGDKAASLPDPMKPLAYLVAQDERAKRYPVTSSIWRIGRSQDNEMTINDSSISRRHAEIQRDRDGSFILYDRDSTNGVFVNNHRVTRHVLKEGDIIEIGDVFLRFTGFPRDYQVSETTAMVRTRAPANS